jgi:hypothetical protein
MNVFLTCLDNRHWHEGYTFPSGEGASVGHRIVDFNVYKKASAKKSKGGETTLQLSRLAELSDAINEPGRRLSDNELLGLLAEVLNEAFSAYVKLN